MKTLTGKVFAVVALSIFAPVSRGMDHVTFSRGGEQHYVDGRIELQAQDGSILVLGRDGLLWRILPKEIVSRTDDDAPFRAYDKEEMVKRTLADLPKGFNVHQTEHYTIFYNGSQAYAQWCGALFERLFMAFRNSWSHQGFEMAKPEVRLVAVIFANKASYVKYSEKALGDAADSIIGYYELDPSNRIIMYDLTDPGVNGPEQSKRVGPSARIAQFLANPEAVNAVSTIVHEATHQIAFNSGLHQRLSDCPKWFSEGIAMYCETPDLGRSKGWAGIGVVNRPKLAQFRDFLQHRRPVKSLRSLIEEDKRLVDTKLVIDAYAESWALTYFLIHKHPKEYIAYLKDLSRKQPLVIDGKEKRVAEFEKRFGSIDTLEAEFVNYIERMH
jgi:hypothetical protein